jgi:hypothetical protein
MAAAPLSTAPKDSSMGNSIHLTEPGADEFERQLFASARQDAVPDASRQRVALALGLGPLAPAGAGSLQPSGEASLGTSARLGGGASARPLPPTSGLVAAGNAKLAVVAKSMLIGLAGGVIALAVFSRSHDAPGTGNVADLGDAVEPVSLGNPGVAPTGALALALPAPAAPGPAAAESEPALIATAPEGAKASARPPRRARVERARRPTDTGVVPAPDSASQLLAEVRWLDTARDALAAGHSHEALLALARYGEQFPQGKLTLDAAVLEVRALARSGQSTRAHRLALRTLSRPDSARYRSELEALAHPLAAGAGAP